MDTARHVKGFVQCSRGDKSLMICSLETALETPQTCVSAQVDCFIVLYQMHAVFKNPKLPHTNKGRLFYCTYLTTMLQLKTYQITSITFSPPVSHMDRCKVQTQGGGGVIAAGVFDKTINARLNSLPNPRRIVIVQIR